MHHNTDQTIPVSQPVPVPETVPDSRNGDWAQIAARRTIPVIIVAALALLIWLLPPVGYAASFGYALYMLNSGIDKRINDWFAARESGE